MIPDAEAVVTAYLDAELTTRIVPRTPSSTGDPWVRVTLLYDDSTDGGVIDRSTEFTLQLDCFAGRSGSQATAALIYRQVREAMTAITGVRSGVVVSGCEVVGAGRSPDTTFEPAMERYIATATVWMHS